MLSYCWCSSGKDAKRRSRCYPGEIESQSHTFKTKVYRRPRPCDLCRQPIHDEGSCCRVCKYACHKECEGRVIASCESSVNYELQSHEGLRQSHTRRPRSPGTRSLDYHRSPREMERLSSFMMDITYITERIIVLTFPESGTDATYRNNLKEVTRMLRTKHGNKYMVFNLSEKRHDLSKLNEQVHDFGWPAHLAPPLEKLCSICKSLDSWLNSDPQHIGVLHSKGDRGRMGVVVAAYMHYNNICASADQALDRFAMKRFYDDKLSTGMHPSQRRYVHYFAGLLSGAIKMNNNSLYLHYVIIQGVPNFDFKGGCKPFIKIYQGMQPVYTSGVYTVTDRAKRVIITLDPSLPLRGDLLIKCYHKKQRPMGRSVIFKVQFHTCTLNSDSLVFRKDDLDEANTDSRFPEEGRVEFQFSYHPEEFRGNGSVNDAMVPVDTTGDPIVRWDSYEDFYLAPKDSLDGLDTLETELRKVPHTEGPLDGSLYAMISKKKPQVAPGQPQMTDELSDLDGPHTISMDSGISSSSGIQGQATFNSLVPGKTNGVNGPPSPNTVEVEVHWQPTVEDNHKTTSETPSVRDEQTELDQLLDGMLREIQSIPDRPLSNSPINVVTSSSMPIYKTYSTISTSKPSQHVSPKPTHHTFAQTYSPPSGIISVNGTKQIVRQVDSSAKPASKWTPEELPSGTDGYSMPHHARKSSGPFSYGIISSNTAVPRRRTLSESPILPSSRRDLLSSPEPSGFKMYDDSSLTWLQKQQLKLKARREGRGWDDTQLQLIDEFQNTHPKKSLSSNPEFLDEGMFTTDLSSSSRENSPAKNFSYTMPLHVHTINEHTKSPSPSSGSYTTAKPPIGRGTSAPSSPIIPSRSSSRDVTRSRYQQWQSNNRPLVRQRSDTSYDREKPIVSVIHQQEQDPTVVNDTMPQQVVTISTTTTYGTIYPHSEQQLNFPDLNFQPGNSHTLPAAKTPPSSDKQIYSNEPKTSSDEVIDPVDLLALLSDIPGAETAQKPRSPEPTPGSPSKLEELEQSLQVMSMPSRSPTQSPQPPPVQCCQTFITYPQSTPNKAESIVEGPPTWSPSVISSSPPESPTKIGDRPATPSFPVGTRTPYANQESPSPVAGLPPKSPTLSRKDRSPSPATFQTLRQDLVNVQPGTGPHSANGQSSPTVYFGQSRRSSMLSLTEPSEVITHHPLFVKDTSKFWYKPNISREEAISILKDKPPGTFVVRDSNSFPGAFGLALKVATPPPNVQNKSGDNSNELVRHFLIEPTSKGVRLKGCPNEPVFGSLSALVYQHSITPLALPCRLLLPEADPCGETVDVVPSEESNSASSPLVQGAACNVLYLSTVDMESLTGPQAIRKAIAETLAAKPAPTPTVVHFKVSTQGITLTDSNRKLFFRRHYPVNNISHCGVDPEDRHWEQQNKEGQTVNSSRCFGFVAKKPASKTDNQCHVFAEMEPEQPASAIVNFVTKVMLSATQQTKSSMI
ncbi:tensin-3-like isoform X3 [Tachypleus tridentatus]|uniref:tensin-3-like isoform X3 n=1 Tax=Tachypleus tridentatus TaxID=6853 RepID=UPI003FD1E100